VNDRDDARTQHAEGDVAASSAEPESAPPKGRGGGFALRALPVAAAAPLVFLALNLWWFHHRPEGFVYLGYLQGDQPTYTAFARAVFGRGNGLIYANPFDFNPSAPRVLSNLGYVVLGWLIKSAGGRTVVAWEAWRLGFGLLCYGLFAALVARFFENGRFRWWVLAAGVFGGGNAWVAAAAAHLAHPGLGWLQSFIRAERGYDFWCLNLFRQSLYPLELAYHALFFAGALCYLDRRRAVLPAIVFLLWWTHPVTAILATTVLALSLAAGWRAERDGKEALALAGVAAASVLWITYYSIFLPRYPSIRSWIEQTLSFSSGLRAGYYLRAWGILLAALPAAFFFPTLRRYLLRDRAGRLLLFWGLGAFAWANNNLFLPRPIQPMHFTRGYIYLFLLIAAAKGLEFATAGRAAEAARARRPLRLLFAVVLLAAIVPDNVFFVARMALETPRPGLLTIPRDEAEVLDYFERASGEMGILSADRMLGVLIVAHTPHRVFVSETAVTPFFDARLREAEILLATGDAQRAGELGIERVVLAKAPGVPFPRWSSEASRFEVLLENTTYRVGRFVSRGGGANR